MSTKKDEQGQPSGKRGSTVQDSVEGDEPSTRQEEGTDEQSGPRTPVPKKLSVTSAKDEGQGQSPKSAFDQTSAPEEGTQKSGEEKTSGQSQKKVLTRKDSEESIKGEAEKRTFDEINKEDAIASSPDDPSPFNVAGDDEEGGGRSSSDAKSKKGSSSASSGGSGKGVAFSADTVDPDVKDDERSRKGAGKRRATPADLLKKTQR